MAPHRTVGSEVIDEFTESDARVIVVKPNKSSTWRANLYVLIAISIPSLGAAIGFTLLEPGQYSRSQARNSCVIARVLRELES